MEISFAIGGAITSGLLTATARANKQFSAQGKASHLHRQLIDGSPRSAEEQEKLFLSAALPLEGNRERAGGMRQGGHKGGLSYERMSTAYTGRSATRTRSGPS